MPKYDLLVTAHSEFNGEVEADTLHDAVEFVRDALMQRRQFQITVERSIIVSDEPVTQSRMYERGDV